MSKLTSRSQGFCKVGALGVAGLVAGVGLSAGEASAWSSKVTVVEAKAGATVEASGDLAKGATMSLNWAARSSVACFPATENLNFEGNHVLFATALPKRSVMKITAVPDDPTTDVSLYALQIGASDTRLPPATQTATTCEAGYDAKADANPGAAETVTLNATTNPYNVVIGVAGTRGTTSGKFKLEVELATAAEVASATLVPTALTLDASGKAEVSGDLAAGGVVDLGWAANSSMACFPTTENLNFEGNHVVYTVALPKQSDLYVTATPSSPSLDVSVYAYQTSATSPSPVPPNVTSATSCEAGYDAKKDSNPGVAEKAHLTSTTNPYNVLIGVAGPKGVAAGSYKLLVEVKPRK